ncbi:tape measure protein [Hydrogenovibrio sp. 3SP14C1]|uniref:tape measure protein n=1 Tax=Hydrogenovibrio sp. 3SP14C1 TaxID=3038774 RepID=UPI00241771EC|nr:tape measure protein [Hydrogenovibrio sp. 3SP14C1]MDG4811652.1 tape measure protein [Hydrogenovibrio sp. 3SP14C1]
MNDLKLKMVIELAEKVSKPLKRMQGSTVKLNKIMQQSNHLGKAAIKTGLDRFYKKLSSVTSFAARSQMRLRDGFDAATRMGSRFLRRTKSIPGHLKRMSDSSGKVAGRFGRAFALGTAVTVGGAALFNHTFLNTASQFEKFETILQTVEGSSSKAKASMKWVENFAVKTPYELNEVTDAYVRLRSYGLEPTNGLLKTLGDTSSSMGKPLMQAVEAIADAVTGENERLKEFGIKAATTGNIISYEYTAKDGSTKIAQVLKGDREQIQKVLSDIFNEKYAGGMEKLSKTWAGMWSNGMDLIAKFEKMVMSSGAFDWMKGKLKGILETVTEMEANGKLQAMAEKISGGLIKAFETLWNWGSKIYDSFGSVASRADEVAQMLGGWENTIMAIIALPLVPAILAFATAFTSLTAVMLANPIILVIAGIAAAAYYLIANWDKVKAYFGDFWSNIEADWQVFSDWVDGWLGVLADKAMQKWQAFKGVLSGFWDSIKSSWSGIYEWVSGLIDKLIHPLDTLLEYGSKLKGWMFGDDTKTGAMAPASKMVQATALTSMVATTPAMAAINNQGVAPISVEVNAPITINGQADNVADLGEQIEQHIQAAVQRAIQQSMRNRDG